MLLKHVCHNKVYLIEVPGTPRISRQSEQNLPDMLTLRWEGHPVPLYSEPPELIPHLAQQGKYGLRLVQVRSL